LEVWIYGLESLHDSKVLCMFGDLNGLGESGLKRKTLNPRLCALYKHLILSLRALYSLSYPEHETLSLHFSTFKLSCILDDLKEEGGREPLVIQGLSLDPELV